jgi:prephenate dehydratase
VPGSSSRRVGFLGPHGTFAEQALLSQADLASEDLVPLPTIAEVLRAVAAGELDLGFVPIENAIEGTVNQAQDALAFSYDLLIQREVLLDIEHQLMVLPGVTLDAVKVVHTHYMADPQCRRFLAEHLPLAEIRHVGSTAEAARVVAESGDHTAAAIGPAVAGALYGLETIAEDIADHDGNQTRFVVVSRAGVPAPSGHDKTTIVVYQRADEPGSLLSILQEFAARRINLVKLESRPIKEGGLGSYCFVLDAEGHIADELLADALRDLHAKQGGVKFLGSYPRAGAHADSAREHADTRWREADDWIQHLRAQVVPEEAG